jgi:hypothetical protein
VQQPHAAHVPQFGEGTTPHCTYFDEAELKQVFAQPEQLRLKNSLPHVLLHTPFEALDHVVQYASVQTAFVVRAPKHVGPLQPLHTRTCGR